MLNAIVIDNSFPFLVALGLLGALTLIEVVMLLLGGSLLTAQSELEMSGPDVEFDVPLTLSDIEALALDPVEIAELDIETLPDQATPAPVGLAGFLGIGEVPFLIWFATLLCGFGLTGLWGQYGALIIMGAALPVWLVTPIAGLLGLCAARKFSRKLAHMIPRLETSAKSERHLGRSKGFVSQGEAARGRPAEVQVQDGYGNIHHLRAEPLRDKDTIAQGTQVFVLRHKPSAGYRLIALDNV